MRHSNGTRSDVRVKALLEHIVTVMDNACASLLYPEGQLFPHIFWALKNNAILGAMPSFLLNMAASKFPSLAPVSEHIFVRLRDGCLLTTKENAYWHYLFHHKLNKLLNHSSSKMVFKHCLEFFWSRMAVTSNIPRLSALHKSRIFPWTRPKPRDESKSWLAY